MLERTTGTIIVAIAVCNGTNCNKIGMTNSGIPIPDKPLTNAPAKKTSRRKTICAPEISTECLSCYQSAKTPRFSDYRLMKYRWRQFAYTQTNLLFDPLRTGAPPSGQGSHWIRDRLRIAVSFQPCREWLGRTYPSNCPACFSLNQHCA